MASEKRLPGALSRIVETSKGDDKGVKEELQRLEQQERWAKMTPAQRRKAMRDAKRSKMTYDLPVELVAEIRKIAEQEDVSQSDVAAELLIRAVNAVRSGSLELDNKRTAAKSLRWAWKLELSDLDASE
jgi:hypothetical protein